MILIIGISSYIELLMLLKNLNNVSIVLEMSVVLVRRSITSHWLHTKAIDPAKFFTYPTKVHRY